MLTQSDAQDVEVVELTAAEEGEFVQSQCRRLLGMSLDEFARRWYAGEYRDSEDPNVTEIGMLLPDAG